MLHDFFKFRNPKNPLLDTLTVLIEKETDISDFQKIIYLGGFGIKSHMNSHLRLAIEKDNLQIFLRSVPYNKNEDSIILYYLENSEGKSYIVSIYESYEVFSKNQILDIIPCDPKILNGLKTEIIYPI